MFSYGFAMFSYGFGELPWIALGLAGTFSVYGVLRKVADVGPLIGLTMETLILVPAALLLLGLWTYISNYFCDGFYFWYNRSR